MYGHGWQNIAVYITPGIDLQDHIPKQGFRNETRWC
jgi:hypothetical protein